MVNWPASLIREIADRRALLFIGAGISKAAMPRLPTWGELLAEFSKKLDSKRDSKLVLTLIKNEKLLDAAQIVSDGMEKADFNQELRDIFQIRPIVFNEIYKNILSLDLKTVITTNYDELLERNFEHYSGGNAAYNVCKHTSKDLLDKLRSPGGSIVKIHGCISEPGDLVLDRVSYFKARRESFGFFDVVSALLTVNTVLFLGYSFGDPDMQIILENINKVYKSTNGHYALLPRQRHRSIVKAIKETYNISCIEYPEGRHEEVPIYVELLSQKVQEVRLMRGVA